MSFVKTVSSLFDDFFLNNGFKRKGSIYFRFRGEVLQAVAFKERSHHLRIQCAAMPYWAFELHDYLMTGDSWVHNNKYLEIHSYFETNDYDIEKELLFLFDIFRVEYFDTMNEAVDFISCYEMHKNVQELNLENRSKTTYDFYKKGYIHTPNTSLTADVISRLYYEYQHGKDWNEISTEWEPHLVESRDILSTPCAPMDSQAGQAILDKMIARAKNSKIVKQLELLKSGKPLPIHPRIQLIINVYDEILSSKSLSAIEKYVDYAKNNEETVEIMRDYFKMV